MLPKKKDKANLEKVRFIFFEIGVIITLSCILLAFEWPSIEKENHSEILGPSIDIEQIETMVTRRDEVKPKVEKPKIAQIINPVPDDVELPDDIIDFGNEADEYDRLDYYDLEPNKEDIVDTPIDFFKVEDKPLFNGGKPEIEFRRYIAQHVKYPEEAAQNGVDGRVVLTFIIDKKGKLVDIEVLGSAHQVLDEEAVRVFRNSPLWTPGKQSGKPVAVRYQFPVVFRLN